VEVIELKVEDRMMAVETERVANEQVEEIVKLLVEGKELDIDGRVVSVLAGRVGSLKYL